MSPDSHIKYGLHNISATHSQPVLLFIQRIGEIWTRDRYSLQSPSRYATKWATQAGYWFSLFKPLIKNNFIVYLFPVLSLQEEITTLRRRRRVPSMPNSYEDFIPLQELEPDIPLDETLDELTPLLRVPRFRTQHFDSSSLVIDPQPTTNPNTIQVKVHW